MNVINKLICVLIVMLSMGSMTIDAKTYLVSVGIADYPGTRNDLNLTAKDAKTIAWVYEQNGNCQYQLLINKNATIANIKRAMNALYSKAKADDVVVFFFSGHGMKGYFIAYDGTLSYSTVRQAMASSKAKVKLIFADACYSGKMGTSTTNSESEETSARNASVLLFLSSRSNETSLENRAMSNGLFTTYLQKALRGGADTNRDRVITARELFEYVHSGVVDKSRGRQHPVMWGKFADTLPVLKW